MTAPVGREVKVTFSFVCMCLGVAPAEADDAAREDGADFATPFGGGHAVGRKRVWRSGQRAASQSGTLCLYS